jgi:hypothetical protein
VAECIGYATAETVKVDALVNLDANVAKIIIEERGGITGKEPATVRFDFREELFFTTRYDPSCDNRSS